jgi:Lon protease-like protein
MDMARACLRDDSGFGVCLIAQGQEVGTPALPHAVGTVARIADWDMADLGVLQVTVRGGQRFRILAQSADRHGLIHAAVQWVAPEPACAVGEPQQRLLPLLRALVADLGSARMPEPHDYEDAVWVGYRLAETLPIPLAARQQLLELADTAGRLEILLRYLAQFGLSG